MMPALVVWCGLVASTLAVAAESTEQSGSVKTCSLTVMGKQVILESPAFAFTLDTSDGLRAVSWENRLTKRILGLGRGPEVEFDIGLPNQPLTAPMLRVVKMPQASTGSSVAAAFELASDETKALVAVLYRWDAKQPVLRKYVTIINNGESSWNRLLNIRTGRYMLDVKAEATDPDYPAFLESVIGDLAGNQRGFPAYVEWQYFVGLAHPAGFAKRCNQELVLQQLPGITLAPGASFACMEAVYGVSREGQARQAFRDHLLTRMRRVLRGHDQPLAIFEPFGAKPDGDFWETEEFVLDNIAKVATGQRDSGLHWDFYSIDFWTNPQGDLKTPDAGRFPNGFTKILPELEKLGTLPGLWVDSGHWGDWTIADNPAVERALTPAGGRKKLGLCRATEPANRFYVEGFAHQLRHHGVRLVKFDNAQLTCSNPDHEHLPGEYSTEPITNALIEFYRSLDRESPDVFIMLYWRHLSPWWLQYADTVFDVGMHMEGASFSPYPAPRARDSVTRRLDRGRWMLKDWPALGWDTLGIWLSDWPWNSHIGKEAWQSGMVMDISRGHLLAQLWSDTPYLSPDERRQMADFIALLKAQSDCFRNSRFIIGNPWKDEPYGYCCTNGKRAFLAINNGVWQDNTLTLELNPAWGLPEGQRWNLYRWWPDPARLGGEYGSQATLALRPFDIVLLEIVPAGEPPALARTFKLEPLPVSFTQPSRELTLTVSKSEDTVENDPVAWSFLEPIESRSAGGATLIKQADHSILASGENPQQDSYFIKLSTGLSTINAIRLETLPDESLPHKGPGRAVNGNFTLAEFTVMADGRPVPIARAQADIEQTDLGGWRIKAVIDGKPETGWGIDPTEGMRHVAVFELAQPLSVSPGTIIEIRLDHAGQQHSIGRLRLSATSEKPPISIPPSETRFIVRGSVPAAGNGGLLAVSDMFFAQSNPYWSFQCKSGFAIVGTLDSRPVAFEPVVNNGNYRAPWQTWRLTITPSDRPRPFELRVTSSLPSIVEHHFTAHFIPGKEQDD